MRLGVLGLGLLLAAMAAHGQRNSGKDDDTPEAKRACGVEDCFLARDVRDFEVIDQTHVIVYTGSQRCAFHVELRGTLCDLTFAPELYFNRPNDIPDREAPGRADPFSRTADPFDPLGTASRSSRHLRICSNDLNIQVHGGGFTESATTNVQTDRFGNPRTNCQVSSVTSITDDQLVEFYVARGVIPPLPPMGTGEIEIGEQQDDDREEQEERE
jgi:hypothetical protein